MRFPLRRLATFATLAAVVALAAPPHAAASSDAWFEGRPPDGSFRVMGPVAFEPFTQEDEKDPASDSVTQGVRGTQSVAFDGKTHWIASCVVRRDDARSESERIEEALANWSKQARPAYQRPVKTGALEGLEFEIADRVKTIRVRLFAPPRRTCTVLVQWPHVAKPRPEDVARFFDSFTTTAR
jgi:hypothetical protein